MSEYRRLPIMDKDFTPFSASYEEVVLLKRRVKGLEERIEKLEGVPKNMPAHDVGCMCPSCLEEA